MLPTPVRYKLVAGSGEGNTRLTAFDTALLNAGAGNLNLLRVSSILPPRAVEDPNLTIPPGSLTPVAYGTLTSDQPEQIIAAAIGVGIAEDPAGYGIIMEYEGYCSRKEAEDVVTAMVREGFAKRGVKLQRILVKGVEHRVEKCGSVFAAVLLWY